MVINRFYRFILISVISGSLQAMDTSPDTKATATNLSALSQASQAAQPMDLGQANGNSVKGNSNAQPSPARGIDLAQANGNSNGNSHGNAAPAHQSSSSSNNSNGSNNSQQPQKKRKLSIVSSTEDRIVLRNETDQNGAAAPKRQRTQAPENADLKAKLLDAIKAGSVKEVESLIAQGAPLNFIARSYFLKNENLVMHSTCLDYAAKHGNLAIVKKLLEAKAIPDVFFETPLHNATTHGNLDAMARLLSAGAYSDAAERDGATPLILAQITAQQKMNIFCTNPFVKEAQITLLTSNNATKLPASMKQNLENQNNSQNQSMDGDLKVAHDNNNNIKPLKAINCDPLCQAIRTGLPEKVRHILQQNAHAIVDLVNSNRMWVGHNRLLVSSPLSEAAFIGNKWIIKDLLDAKACPNVGNMNALTYAAVVHESLDMTFALLQHGAYADHRFKDGGTLASRIQNPVIRDAMIALLNTHKKKNEEGKKAEEGKSAK